MNTRCITAATVWGEGSKTCFGVPIGGSRPMAGGELDQFSFLRTRIFSANALYTLGRVD